MSAKAGHPLRRGRSAQAPLSLEYCITRWSLPSGGAGAGPGAGDDSHRV